ncbi:MAG: hypothetical protein HKN93_08290 [Acidimicrobiia bacterium]|nr:hypothetical protein [Acidimicrobiia bacterium]
MRYLLLLLLLLAVGLVGCSNADDTRPVASLETTEAPQRDETSEQNPEIEAESAMLDFTQCLRDQGIDIGDPTMGADGNLQLPPIEFAGPVGGDADIESAIADMDAVFAECEQHLEGVTFGAPDPGAGVAFEDALLEYSGCMRDQGIDMPDPDFSGDGGAIVIGSDSPSDEAEFEAAHRECQSILAGAGLDF